MASPLKTPDDILNEIYAKMALEPEPQKSMPRRAWDTVTEPIKDVLGYTQNVGAQALRGLGADESYAAAEEQLRQEYGLVEGEPDAKALPGVGDVAFAALPEELKQSLVGRALSPVVKIGGNILGDPLTYLPGGQLGALGKLGAKTHPRTAAKIGKITEAVPGAAKALGAGERTVRALNSPLR